MRLLVPQSKRVIPALLVLGLAASGTAAADAPPGSDAAPTPPAGTTAYQQLSQTHQDDPAFQAFERHLGLVQQVRQDLQGAFEQQRTQALDSLLDQTLNTPELSSGPSTDAPMGTTAVELLHRYEGRFREPLPTRGFSTAEQKALRSRYAAAIAGAEQRIAERGRAVAAAEPKQAMHAMSLSLVFPMLHVTDARWSDSDMAGLPTWLREPANLRQLEDFALKAHRPLTAYVFAAQARDPSGGEDAKPVDRPTYLQATSDRLLRDQRYDDALVCLEAAQGLAEKAGNADQANQIVFHITQVLSDTGKPKEAAQRVEPLLLAQSSAETYARAAMLRLKYLYEAQQYRQVLDASTRYRADKRTGMFLPQVLYITWAAARRDDAQQVANQMRKTFLEKFPRNVLGADLYFAQAMAALAQSNYDEADRLLEYIAYRYPQSRLIDRVKQIRDRLNQRDKPSKKAASPAGDSHPS